MLKTNLILRKIMTNSNNAKKQFVVPTLVEYGKFEELTQGSSSGKVTDKDFPAGTSDVTLTFSS